MEVAGDRDLELSRRFKAARDHLGFSQKEMAKELGIALSSWQRYEQGQGLPNGDLLLKLNAMGISIDWLATGGGAMLMRDRVERLGHLVHVPQYSLRPAAGGGAIADSEEPAGFLALEVEWIRKTLGINPANLVLMEAGGDSMEPTIFDRDPLLIDRSDKAFRSGAIYVIRVDDAVQVKRISRRSNGDLLLMSDNKHYPAEPLPKADAERLRVIGRVVWHGHRL